MHSLPNITLACLTLLFIAGCSDYTIPVGNECSLVRLASGGTFVLADREGFLLAGPSVDRYSKIGVLVVGRVTEEPTFPQPGKNLGYFIFNTETGIGNWGLSENQWISALEQQGMNETPQLYRPNRFHQLSGPPGDH